MKLYLVQHAEAKSKEEDPERSLSEKGLADIKKVARYAAEHAGIQVSQINHSGKLRTMQTAEILAEHLNPSGGLLDSEDLKALAEPNIRAGRLADISEDTMLVGHLPHLEKLASLLLCGDEDRKVVSFTNAGIVCIQRDEDGGWSVLWIITPETL